MPFVLPTFNLHVKQFRGCNPTTAFPGGGVAHGAFQGNLASWARLGVFLTAGPILLCPPLQDIVSLRVIGGINTYDMLEIPSGSGRWYYCNNVDDVGKGFANEHRVVGLSQTIGDQWAITDPSWYWPIPYP
jgi:hypothetical protein